LTRNKDGLLYNVYTLTLETIFPKRILDSIGLCRFRPVMAQITATEPLPLASLQSMRSYLSSKEFDVGVIVKPMGALLSGTTDPPSTIRPLRAFCELLKYTILLTVNGDFVLIPAFMTSSPSPRFVVDASQYSENFR
jgi:hypothetical protein